MPRPRRVIIPNFPYHLTHRGNNKQQLFFSEKDYRKYLFLLEEWKSKFGMKVWAYCLMPNHIHIIACAARESSIPNTINQVHGQFAQYYNGQSHSVGHVWQGRYYSCLLEGNHLLAALRYVERNPVRANIVKNACDWVWSSAREHVNNKKGIISLEHEDLAIDWNVWGQFLNSVDVQEFVDQIRKQTNARKALGTEEYKREMSNRFGVDLLDCKMGRPRKE